MGYTMNIRVRYSECSGDGTVPLHQLLNYFQDCATFQSEEIGYGIEYNKLHHLAWFLLAYDIQVNRRPCMFEELAVITYPYKMKGHYGYRKFEIRDREDHLLVSADSVWILMDTESLLPSKVSEEMSRAFVPDPEEVKVRIKRKIRAGDQWDPVSEFDISEIHLDTNRHVNNNYYAMWTENLIARDRIGRVRIDYRKAALLGDHIIVSRQNQDGTLVFRYENQDGELLAFLSVDGEKEEENKS